MQLSLSVRIAEGFLSKEEAVLDLNQVLTIARDAGYDAVCMRASQIGVHSNAEMIEQAAKSITSSGLKVSMVTGDFDIVYNNEDGPSCLRNIAPYLELAYRLGAPMIRVALKKATDITWAREAAELATRHKIAIVHQCHTLSLFETVESIEETIQAIDHPNFGLIYEPANLELCKQDYGRSTIRRLGPWIKNVYLQNQRLRDDGSVTLETWCAGPRTFDIIPIHEDGGIDFRDVMAGLRAIDYDGPVTIHQSAPEGGQPAQSARATADFIKNLIN